MKVIVFGATGMVGQGVLQECLEAADVAKVLAVVRTPTGRSHPKLEEVRHADFADLSPLVPAFAGYDACLYCLGVSSAGMSESDYRRVTLDYTVAAGRALVAANPAMTVCFISGQNTDATGTSKTLWARVKGEAENALAAMPFRAVLRFRPGFIQPVKGAHSKTPLYRALYAVLSPLFPLIRAVAPRQVVTTASLGQSMLAAVRLGEPSSVLEPPDIHALLERAG